jgi:hypothetical protein
MSISEQSTAEGKALKEGKEGWECSEDGGIIKNAEENKTYRVTVIKGGMGRCQQWRYRYHTILQKY